VLFLRRRLRYASIARPATATVVPHAFPYDVSIGGATVPGVDVAPGHDTLVKAGALRIRVNNTTTYEILDTINRSVAKGFGGSITALPIGSYQVRLGGQMRTVQVAEGQITDF
jgi:hypothetical protein